MPRGSRTTRRSFLKTTAAAIAAPIIVPASAIGAAGAPPSDRVVLGMIGMGYGLISGVTFGAVAFYWPKPAFGRIAGRIYVAWCLAAIVLPVLAGQLYDLTGGYGPAVIVAGAANMVATVVAVTLPSQARSLATHFREPS